MQLASLETALVTGGAGFIGSHIVDELVARGIKTLVLDDCSSGSHENLGAHKGSKMLEIKTGDIRNIQSVLSDSPKIDVVFHEAAIASVPKSVSDPKFVHDINVNGSLEVLEFCVKRKIRRIVFASSAAVYGNLSGPLPEETLYCKPASPYGASKLAIENYLCAYYNAFGLETVALRYFNVYGPRQSSNEYSGVITKFIDALLRGAQPTIYGDGLQSRDFVHVKDIVQANLLAATSPRAAGQVYNVASGRVTTINELFEFTRVATGTPSVTPKYAPDRPGDVRVGLSSIVKIRGELGYKPQVSLSEGLPTLVEFKKKKDPVPARQLV